MLRPNPPRRSIRRIMGSFMLIASVVLVSPTAADAQRGGPSPYAFEDPVTPGIDVGGTDAGTTSNPGVPASSQPDPVPAVSPTEVPQGGAVADPAVNPRGTEHGDLARTGAQGLTSRIAFAMVLVAIGLLASEASGRRRRALAG